MDQRMPKILEKDGVIYVPSGGAPVGIPDIGASFGGSPQASSLHKEPAVPKRKMKTQRSQLTVFYILTLTIGVIICVAVFGIVLNYFNNSTPSAAAQPTPPPELAGVGVQPGISFGERIEISGVISSIDVSDRRLRVLDAATGRTLVLGTNFDTSFLNRNRNEISLASFSVGNIVDIRYHADTYMAESVQISHNGWEQRMIRGVYVNTDRHSINIGASNYSFDENTIVMYRNYRFDIDRIDPIDVVTISGLRSQVLFVEVNRSHGTVRFINADDVRNGTVEINTSIFQQLTDTPQIRLQEGAHRIVVRGDNIEPMVREIVLSNNQTIDIDLATAQYRTGALTVNINITGYRLEINGTEHSSDHPIILPMDEEITVSVTRNGFIPFLQVIELTQPMMEMDIHLDALVEMAMLVIRTIPSGATIVVNGNTLGTSPLSELMPFGRHSVQIRHPGYETWSMTFDLNEPRQEYQIMLTSSASVCPTATPTPWDATPSPSPSADGQDAAATPTPGQATPLPTPMPFPTPMTTPAPTTFPTPAPIPTPTSMPTPPPVPEQSPAAGPNSAFNFSQVDEFRDD